MSLSLLLEMSASGDADRVAVIDGDLRLTVGQLEALADGGAGVIANSKAKHVCYVGTGGVHLPLLLFSAARAAVHITPLNYRLSGRIDTHIILSRLTICMLHTYPHSDGLALKETTP